MRLIERLLKHSGSIRGYAGTSNYDWWKKVCIRNTVFVLATQNPIEQEGTYPLPEAQLDRFMFNVWLDYPKFAEELQVVK